MIVAGLDTETTGLDVHDGHRLIEICVQLWDFDTRTCRLDWTQRINPKRTIQPSAAAVHGIKAEMLVGEPDWEEVAPKVSKLLGLADQLVIHNAEFDMGFLNVELPRVGFIKPATPWFCTMMNGRWATWNGKVPSLGELAYACGVEYDPSKAHAASYDVGVMMACYWRGLDLGFFRVTSTI